MSNRFTMKRSNEDTTPEPGKELKISPFELVALLVRRKRIIVGSVLVAMVAASMIMLMIPNKYSSVATILPTASPDKMSELKSLAGLGGMMGQGENSAELYPVILASQTVCDAVLEEPYIFENDGQTVSLSLIDYFNENNPDKLREALGSITSVANDKKTGVITMAVETEFPAFSQAILTQYLDELEFYNLHERRSQALERVAYLSRELIERKVNLEASEDSLAAFQGQNRDWMGSTEPVTAKLLARLKRVVQIDAQTYLYLTQEYEIAKLDAQKDVPVVRILDSPTLATKKTGPKRTLAVVIVTLVSLFAAMLGVIVTEAIRLASTGPNRPAYENLRADFTREFPRISRVINRQREEVGV